MEQIQNIEWTKSLEKYLKQVGEHSLCLSVLHKKCEAKFSNKALCIDLPVIVLSTLCGSLTLSAKSLFGDMEDGALKIVGGLSLTTSIIATIQAYFGYSRRAENHRNSYLEYSKQYRFIKIELGLPRHSRIRPKDLLKIVNDSFERLNELSPLVPLDIIAKFKKTYKKSKIERPPELNGLDEIEIYTPSECDEIIVENNTVNTLEHVDFNADVSEIIDENRRDNPIENVILNVEQEQKEEDENILV
tara:strand:+ start:232 stop:969 length:738 start_codon:yes stop_codon:yes gene_type:complete